MPGGPVAAGGGIGANAPKSKYAGILMVCPFYPAPRLVHSLVPIPRVFATKTAFAAFGGILFGYDTGTISGLQQMPDWLRTFGHPVPVSTSFPDGYGISSSQRSLIVSILSAGTFFGPFNHPHRSRASADFIYLGALLAAPFADILGRKWGIITSCLVFSIGVALQTAATAIPLFVVGRVFAGLGVGLVSTLVPMYQSECSPKWIRGAVVGLYQWAITIGLLLSSIFNNATKNRPNHSSYRIPIAIQFIWAAILAAGMVFLPEVCSFVSDRPCVACV